MFEFLKDKKIIGILDGDEVFKKIVFTKRDDFWGLEDKTLDISLPYLSGPDICSMSNMFGLNQDYDSSTH